MNKAVKLAFMQCVNCVSYVFLVTVTISLLVCSCQPVPLESSEFSERRCIHAHGTAFAVNDTVHHFVVDNPTSVTVIDRKKMVGRMGAREDWHMVSEFDILQVEAVPSWPLYAILDASGRVSVVNPSNGRLVWSAPLCPSKCSISAHTVVGDTGSNAFLLIFSGTSSGHVGVSTIRVMDIISSAQQWEYTFPTDRIIGSPSVTGPRIHVPFLKSTTVGVTSFDVLTGFPSTVYGSQPLSDAYSYGFMQPLAVRGRQQGPLLRADETRTWGKFAFAVHGIMKSIQDSDSASASASDSSKDFPTAVLHEVTLIASEALLVETFSDLACRDVNVDATFHVSFLSSHGTIGAKRLMGICSHGDTDTTVMFCSSEMCVDTPVAADDMQSVHLVQTAVEEATLFQISGRKTDAFVFCDWSRSSVPCRVVPAGANSVCSDGVCFGSNDEVCQLPCPKQMSQTDTEIRVAHSVEASVLPSCDMREQFHRAGPQPYVAGHSASVSYGTGSGDDADNDVNYLGETHIGWDAPHPSHIPGPVPSPNLLCPSLDPKKAKKIAAGEHGTLYFAALFAGCVSAATIVLTCCGEFLSSQFIMIFSLIFCCRKPRK